jgi:hypothetical protein
MVPDRQSVIMNKRPPFLPLSLVLFGGIVAEERVGGVEI